MLELIRICTVVWFSWTCAMQRILKCGHMQNTRLTSDKTWTFWYMEHLPATSYTGFTCTNW